MLLVKDLDESIVKAMPQFGLRYTGDKLIGKLTNFDPIDADIPSDKYDILRAYLSVENSGAELAIYVKDLSDDGLLTLEKQKLSLNCHNVILIKDITYKTFGDLQAVKNQSHCCSVLKYTVDTLLNDWPTIQVARQCTTTKKTLQLNNSPRFDYTYGAMVYHTILPVPFDDLDNGIRKEYVLVNVNYDISNPRYEHLLSIGNHPIIYTNSTPHPRNIMEIVRRNQSLTTKVKQFISMVINKIKYKEKK